MCYVLNEAKNHREELEQRNSDIASSWGEEKWFFKSLWYD